MSDSPAISKARYRLVRLNELRTDPRFNRPVSQSTVDRIVSEFNAEAFRVIEVWETPEGLVILDGQNRTEAARRVGVPEDAKCIPANVHTGLTLAAAAELFVELNASRLVSAFAKFHALRTAGHPETIAIDQIVRTQGLIVAEGQTDGCVSGVVTLRKVYQMGEPRGAVLAQTLATLCTAWGDISEAFRSTLIRGLAGYFNEHRQAVPADVAEHLVRGPGAPINLIGWAKAVAGTQRLPLHQAITEVMTSRVMKPARKVRSA